MFSVLESVRGSPRVTEVFDLFKYFKRSQAKSLQYLKPVELICSCVFWYLENAIETEEDVSEEMPPR
jgi:hypothetical protein